jgi:hypothetical protein
MSKAAVWESSGEMAGLARLCAALSPLPNCYLVPTSLAYKSRLMSTTGSRSLQAVPLLDLLAAFTLEGFDRLKASVGDGFVAQIPLALIETGKCGGSAAWVAIEDPNHPWPKLPGRNASAGPFYLIWQYPERSRVSNEQWPYMLEN